MKAQKDNSIRALPIPSWRAVILSIFSCFGFSGCSVADGVTLSESAGGKSSVFVSTVIFLTQRCRVYRNFVPLSFFNERAVSKVFVEGVSDAIASNTGPSLPLSLNP